MPDPIIAPPLVFGPIDAGVAYANFPAVQAPPYHDSLQISDGPLVEAGFFASGGKLIFTGGGLAVFTGDHVFVVPDRPYYYRDAAIQGYSFTWPGFSITVRAFAAASLYLKLIGGGVYQFTSNTSGVTNVAHGLAPGDRIWISDSRDSDQSLDRVLVVLTTPTTSTATLRGSAGVTILLDSPTSHVVGVQAGRTLADLPINNFDTGATRGNLIITRGVPMSYPILSEVGAPAGAISAANVPDGLGLYFDGTGWALAGTAVEFGWFPVVLQAGNMRRYLSLRIDPGTYDNLITSASTSTATAGRVWTFQALAPSLSGTVTWTLNNAPFNFGYNTFANGNLTGTFAAPGLYTFDLVASNGTDRVTKTMTVTVSPDVPAVQTEFDGVNQSTFASANNEAIRIPFSATNSPTSWSATGLPAGLALDAPTGVLTGYVALPGLYAFSVIAANGTGVSVPAIFKLRVTLAENAVNRAPYLPWLHSDSAVIDLQTLVRQPRTVSSYYMSAANTLEGFLGDDLRLAVLLIDPTLSEPYLAGATGVQIGFRRAEEYDDSYFWFSQNASARTSSGHAWYEFEGKLDGPTMRNWLDELNDPLDPAAASVSIPAMCQIRWISPAGIECRSAQFAFTILQPTLQGTGPLLDPISGPGYPPPNLVVSLDDTGHVPIELIAFPPLILSGIGEILGNSDILSGTGELS